jgi:hypothetical protein
MTVEPMKYDQDGTTILPGWNTLLTCRDFDSIREWALSRDATYEQRMCTNAARLSKLRNVTTGTQYSQQ